MCLPRSLPSWPTLRKKAGNLWMLEQPATSLMWLFKPIFDLVSRATSFMVTIDVCMFGAPWRKPTSLAANFHQIMRLFRRCDGRHTHISLQGNAPCGRSWTAVASPYWPAFASEWVRICYELSRGPLRKGDRPAILRGCPRSFLRCLWRRCWENWGFRG